MKIVRKYRLNGEYYGGGKFKVYCFQKKDGTVKKYYKEAIDYILTATVQKHEIMVGRSDEVGKIYECYTTKRKRFLEPKRNTIQSKIIDICAEFGCYTNPWYSGYQEISLELHGDNVEFMLNELRKY